MNYPKELWKKEQPSEYKSNPISIIVQNDQELKKVPFDYVLFLNQVIFKDEDTKKVLRRKKDE